MAEPNEITPSNKPHPGAEIDVAQESLFGVEFHQGPLPHARDFAAYERVLPGAADRILTMAEQDQKAAIRLSWLRWLASFAVLMVSRLFLYLLLFAAVYLAMNDKPLEALLAGLAPIVVTIYSNTRRDDSPERDTKDE